MSIAGGAPIDPAIVPRFVPGQLLVQFEAGVGDQAREQFLGRFGAGRDHTVVEPGQGRGGMELVNLPPGLSVAAAAGAFEVSPIVSFAEPNWIYTTQATSNDPYYTNGSLWGMYGDTTTTTNQFGSQAGEAWVGGNVGSSSVYVGVIDTGIQFSHPDLVNNFWVNPFDSADGTDNDGNGYVDDIRGWDFHNNDNTVYDSQRHDQHGTHVAGTIGAEGGNGIGVAGVNWDVTLISGKFLGPNGGTTANAIRAIDYFTDLKTRPENPLNIVATNNSWGGGGLSQGLFDAIDRANKAGILFIAAAGNDGRNIDSSPSYPASYTNSNIIAVAALESNGNLASYSNYGTTSVDLAAPGSGILSTLPNNTYGTFSGTSMAAPHVAGAAALYASKFLAVKGYSPTAAEVKGALLNTVISTDSLAGKTATGGRLDVAAALNSISTQDPTEPPTAPSITRTAVLSSSQVFLSWADNSTNEQGFLIEWSTDSFASSAGSATVGAGVTSYQVGGLAYATPYQIRVSAYNTGGSSDFVQTAATTALAVSMPYLDGFNSDPTVSGSAWTFTTAEWAHSSNDATLTQPSTAPSQGERKAMAVGVEGMPTDITARVKLTAWQHGEYARAGVGLFTDPLSGLGYNLVVTGRHGEQKYVEFVNDMVAWSGSAARQAITMNVGDWFSFRLKYANGVLYGKVWPDNTSEPTGWTISFDAAANGWNRSGGAASLNGGLSGTFSLANQGPSHASAEFDDVRVSYDQAPTVAITSPSEEAIVSNSVVVRATASDDDAVTRVEFFVDGVSIGADTNGADGWSVSWNTATVGNGARSIVAVATDTAGQTTTSDAVVVTVENAVEALSVTGVTPNRAAPGSTVDVTITGSGFVSGAGVSFSGGQGRAPSVTSVTFVDSGNLVARVSVPSNAKNNVSWLVTVTNPNGTSASWSGKFLVTTDVAASLVGSGGRIGPLGIDGQATSAAGTSAPMADRPRDKPAGLRPVLVAPDRAGPAQVGAPVDRRAAPIPFDDEPSFGDLDDLVESLALARIADALGRS